MHKQMDIQTTNVEKVNSSYRGIEVLYRTDDKVRLGQIQKVLYMQR